MNRKVIAWIVVIAIVVILYYMSRPAVAESFEGNAEDNELLYSAYFTPWWRNYFPGPYYGTSATSLDVVKDWPYDSSYWRTQPNYYNYWSYWRRPLYYNYWRQPYYYKRPVSRPYLQDSIEGRRERLRTFNFAPQEVPLQMDGSDLYGVSQDF